MSLYITDTFKGKILSLVSCSSKSFLLEGQTLTDGGYCKIVLTFFSLETILLFRFQWGDVSLLNLTYFCTKSATYFWPPTTYFLPLSAFFGAWYKNNWGETDNRHGWLYLKGATCNSCWAPSLVVALCFR